MNYKVLSAILGVMVVVLLWLVTAPPKDGVKAPEIQQLNEQTPAGWAAGFVAPAGAENQNNYTAKFESRTDLNQQFTTDMSVAVVLADYDKILKDNGWSTQTPVD